MEVLKAVLTLVFMVGGTYLGYRVYMERQEQLDRIDRNTRPRPRPARAQVLVTRDSEGRVTRVERIGYTNCATCSAAISTVNPINLVQDGWRYSDTYQGWRCDACLQEASE